MDTGYEQLLSAARETETEWVESKTIKAKAVSVLDPGKKERDKLKTRIDKLTKELNKKEKGNFYKKKSGKGENPAPVNLSKGSLRSKGQLLVLCAFAMLQVWRLGSCDPLMPFTGKHELGGAQPGQARPSRDRTGTETIKSAIRSNAGLLQEDLYLNPDPLVRIIRAKLQCAS